LWDVEDSASLWEGGLEKLWFDEDGVQYSDFCPFDTYTDEGTFVSDVRAILASARQAAIAENIDELLAVMDIVKRRMVEAGYDDEAVLDLEGLFQNGPEDAYTLRDIGSRNRLHHHIEREDECWYLHVAPIVDSLRQLLGWGVFAVHLPDLTSDATAETIAAASQARVLLVDHCRDELEARLVTKAIDGFMHEGERVSDPEYAFMNDTEVLEGFALSIEQGEPGDLDIWPEYRDAALKSFLDRSAPTVYERSRWHIRKTNITDEFFERFPQPIWVEDQLRAALEEYMGMQHHEDEGSPWANVELD
jgi:hypothetical protein